MWSYVGMTTQPIPTEAETAAAKAAARMDAFNRKIDRLVDVGTDYVEVELAYAQGPGATVEVVVMCAKSYEGLSRSVRQSIMLACKMMEPAKAARPPRERNVARARVIRGVEDAIERKSSERSEAESLRVELLDRMDAPDFDFDLETRPIEAIIAEIERDLGLGECVGGVPQWRRRTPEMVAVLSAVAAEPAGQRAREDAAPVRVERPQLRVVDPDWDRPDPDKPLSQWSDAELDRALLRNPDG